MKETVAENSYQMLRLVQIEKWRQAVSVFDFYFIFHSIFTDRQADTKDLTSSSKIIRVLSSNLTDAPLY